MTVRLEPMTAEHFASWRPRLIEGYGAGTAEAGAMSEAAALEYAEKQLGDLLPQGIDTPDHHLLVAYDQDQPVGTLWLRIREEWGSRRAFVFYVTVDEDLRGRGYGRALMRAGEEYARSHDAAIMSLNVFARNETARALYDSLGYLVTNMNMQKDLG